MSLGSFSTLKTSIADHLRRDDLTSYISDFIVLAEEQHKNEVRFRDMLERESLTVNARYVDLPAGFLEARSIRLTATPFAPLEQVSLDDMARMRRDDTARPAYFTVHTQIEFDTAPDTSYDGEIIYYKELTPLSDVATSNALLARSPGLYLYGALIAAAPFLLHDERIAVWSGLYTSRLEGLNMTERRARRAGTLVSRVIGSTP